MGKLKTEIEKLLAVNRTGQIQSLDKKWGEACLFAARNGHLSCLLPESEHERDLATSWARREDLHYVDCDEGIVACFR